ncbi:MAG: hypothetical protein JW874_06085, partial [Spirochaetales bacterium]|nr:hypothetical protein [Spirochaetales bacterium]
IPLTRDVLISFPFITIIAFVKMRIAVHYGLTCFKFKIAVNSYKKCKKADIMGITHCFGGE